jgi:hypothetical protein
MLTVQQVVDFSVRSVIVEEDVATRPLVNTLDSIACPSDGKPPSTGGSPSSFLLRGRRRRVVGRIAESRGKMLDNRNERSNIKRIASLIAYSCGGWLV